MSTTLSILVSARDHAKSEVHIVGENESDSNDACSKHVLSFIFFIVHTSFIVLFLHSKSPSNHNILLKLILKDIFYVQSIKIQINLDLITMNSKISSMMCCQSSALYHSLLKMNGY